MKKFAKITAVVLVAVLALAALVACGPATDPKKAKEALDKKGYVTTGSAIAADGLAAKTACDLMGVTVGVKAGELIAIVTATKIDVDAEDEDLEGDVIAIYYFSSASIAKEAWESTFMKEMRDAAKDKDNAVVKLSGSMIYMGSKQGAKDAR